MSSKPRRKSKELVAKAPIEAPRRPSGRIPEAFVFSRRGTDMVNRSGRGFSRGELSGAGLAPRLATDWGVRTDVRRRSVLEGNVESLKTWTASQEPVRKAEGRVKKIEEELVRVEREVKKEGIEAKAETVKVAREVRREATKAEKAVKAKVGKPRAKQKKKKKKATK